jgi:gas vesicle protein
MASGQEPFLTWNFFLTLILVPGVGWFITRSINKSDTLKEKLFKTIVDSLEKSIEDWQIGAKERTGELCKKIDAISHELKDKVSNSHCHDKHQAVKDDINELKSKIYT